MKNENQNIISVQRGKIPPQAVDIEVAVLGALLIDVRGITEMADFLSPEMFYKEAHQIIFETIMEMYFENEGIDFITVSQRLKKKEKIDKIGGDYYLIELTKSVATSAHIEYHARIILQKYIQRSLIKNSSAIIENCYSDSSDVLEVLDHAYNHLNEVAEKSIQQQETPFPSIIRSQIEKGYKLYIGEIKAGIPTPIQQLTHKSGGWRDKELIIMAARPGMGKTSFALKAGIIAAEEGYPTAFFSLEMSKEQLTNRILSMEAKIDNGKFNISGLSEEDVTCAEAFEKKLSKIPFYIDDTAALTIEQFQIKAKRLRSKYGIRIIIVDYLQLMHSTAKKGNREQEISAISRGLKKVSMDLGIPVIALSQLSRAVETRGGNKRPMLSDLRESGAIEQDADMVMFFYRPEYYSIEEWDDYDNSPTAGQAEYIVAKNRNGGLVRNRMRFDAKYTLFSDLDQHNDDDHLNLPLPSWEDMNDQDNTPF